MSENNFRVKNGLEVGIGGTIINTLSNGNVGVGTSIPQTRLHVDGDALFTGIISASSFSGNASNATYATSAGIATYATTAGIATYATSSGIATYATTAGIATYATTAGVATALQNSRTFEITGDIIASPISFNGTGNVSLAATIQPNSVSLGTDTTGDYVQSVSGTSNQITVTGGTGEGSTPTLSIPNQFTVPQDATISRDLLVTRNLNVNGNITIGGTSATLLTTELKIFDPDIVLGIRTDGSGNDVSTDNTANHGGIAIASTEGTPLIQLFDVGIGETNPATYKKFMWFKSGAFSGLGTDAWLSNYAIGIGSTQFPSGTRLAAGAVQFTENDLTVVRNINASGVVTASSFTGNASSATYATTSGVSTNVIGGIGSITQLQVTGVSTFTNGPVLIGSGTSTGTANQRLQVTGDAYVSGNLGIGTTNPQNLLQVTGSSNSVSMTASGRLLVGTSTSRVVGPNERVFQIESVGTSGDFLAGMSITRNVPSTNTNSPVIVLLRTRGSTFGSVDSVVQNDVLGNIIFYGADGTSSNNSGATIQVVTDGPVSTGIVPGRMDFSTRNTAGTISTRMTIKNSGNIGIGTTNPTSTLDVVGDARISGVATVSGNLNVNGNLLFADATSNRIGIGTTNPNTTLDVRGPITVGVGTVGVGSIFLTNEVDAWYYTGKSKSVSADDTNPAAVYVGAAGTALFIVGDTNNRVIQYTLSTPYVVSTAGAAVTFVSTALQETSPTGIDFNSDGTKMFISGQTGVAPLVASGDYVHEYSLSTPWNVSPSSVGWTTSYRITEDTVPNGVTFGDNGTKMYVIGNTNDRIYQYTLTTPYSLASGVSYSGKSLLVSITNLEGTVTDLSFNSDGSKVWVTGSDRDRIYEFTLATNWDISTGSYTNDFFTEIETALLGIHVIPSQNVAYVVGSGNDTVYQFDTNNYSLKLCSDPSKFNLNLSQSSSPIILEGYARVKDHLHVRKSLYVGDQARFASFVEFGGTINHGGSTAALNNTTSANTTSLAPGATASGVQKTINVGTGGAANSRLLVTFGSATAGTISTVAFNPETNLILGLTTATPTGTALQPLQIGSASSAQGAYISGSVGIGTTNPSVALDVVGNARISGNITSAHLQVTGITTFTNGPVLVGSGTSTGTPLQPLQVIGGAYVSGFVGIGTTNPTSRLDIAGDVRVTGVVTASSFSGNASSATTATVAQGLTGTPNITVGIATATTLNVGIGGTIITTNAAGNVGIGTTNPSTKLDVAGEITARRTDTINEGGQITFTRAVDDVSAYSIDVYGNTAANARLRFIDNVSAAERASFDRSGNFIVGASSSTGTASQPLQVTGGAYVSGSVGIGTTNPLSKLHIIGGTTSAGTAPFEISRGSLLTQIESDVFEYDGTNLYHTANDIVNGFGRAVIPEVQFRRLTTNNVVGAAASSFFGVGIGSFAVLANVLYEFECDYYVTKGVAGTVTFTFNLSTGSFISLSGTVSPLTTGITGATGALVNGGATRGQTANNSTIATASLANATSYAGRIKATLIPTANARFTLQATAGGASGTLTVLPDSYMKLVGYASTISAGSPL